jgi:O-antigen/teichoic acid export membrane protein
VPDGCNDTAPIYYERDAKSPIERAMIAKLKHALGDLRSAQTLGGRAMQSGIWITAGFGIQRVLQFGSNLILTRLLFPEAFGTMALATVFLVGLAMFSDIGLKPAVIRDPRGDDPDFLNTAWTIQAIRGLGLWLAGCLLAYPISLIYDQPILFPLLMVLSATAAITGFQSIGMATAERKLDFLRPTVVGLVGQVISIAVLVILAYYWRSVWALAVGNIVGSMATLLAGHLLIRGHRHRFRFEIEAARSITSFGKWIFLTTIVTFLGGEGLRAIQAGLITPAEFGVLAIAYTIAAIAVELPLKITGSVGLPALAEAGRANPDRTAVVLYKLRQRVLIVAVGVAAMIALASESIIQTLYDERYHAAGSYVAALTLSNAIALVYSGYLTLLLARGESRTQMFFNAAASALRIAGVVAGFTMMKIHGMIVGIGFANLIVLTGFWVYFRHLAESNFKLDMVLLATIATSALFASLLQGSFPFH